MPVIEVQGRVIRSCNIAPDEGNGGTHLLNRLIDYQLTGMIGLTVPNQGTSGCWESMATVTMVEAAAATLIPLWLFVSGDKVPVSLALYIDPHHQGLPDYIGDQPVEGVLDGGVSLGCSGYKGVAIVHTDEEVQANPAHEYLEQEGGLTHVEDLQGLPVLMTAVGVSVPNISTLTLPHDDCAVLDLRPLYLGGIKSGGADPFPLATPVALYLIWPRGPPANRTFTPWVNDTSTFAVERRPSSSA